MSLSLPEQPRARTREWENISLMVPHESGLRGSPEAFWRLCVANPSVRLELTEDGEVIVRPPAGSDSGMRSLSVGALLWNWNRDSKLGVAFDSSAGFKLPNGYTRAADCSWISQERWAAVPEESRKKFAPICPDFVVEVLSPSDSLEETRRKMVMYLAEGARLGWLLDPESGLAEIYRPNLPVETLNRPATLSGEDVLPGFVLDLQGILFD